ncbi:putative acylesterase/phospholipase RssA [Amorphus suaedae]
MAKPSTSPSPGEDRPKGPTRRTAASYATTDFNAPTLECDLVMKGGVTSGVVYPFAIAELAKAYRFRSIGGTSAGAIAAVFTAAAEYNRREKTQAGQEAASGEGFKRLCHVAEELGSGLKDLFQPTPTLAPLFEIMMTYVGDRAARIGAGPAILLRLPSLFPLRFAAGLLVFLAIGVLALSARDVWLGVLGFVLGLLATAVLVIRALYRIVARDLRAHDFGICSGTTMKGAKTLAFSDWIAHKIDVIAGNVDANGEPNEPLTVGQLRGTTPGAEIRVATMTTDLSSARPYQLPLTSDIHYFSPKEFRKLFPARLVNYLCSKGERYQGPPCDRSIPDDLRKLPVGDDFPVFLVARMSLSFPGLIQAIPLYREDSTRARGDTAPIRRCLFSDGGISSNFPIHFFDGMLPRRPTFGIALGSLDKDHQHQRIHRSTSGRASTDLPVAAIGSVGNLLSSILNTAKDWQDTLQSLLPGYAERIVTIRLDDEREGGLNIDMDPELVGELAEYGARAGENLRDEFAFSQHRYDRAITMLSALEDSLDGLGVAYDHAPPDADDTWMRYDGILQRFRTANYPNPDGWRQDPLNKLASDLAALGQDAHERYERDPSRAIRGGNLPPRDYRLRLVAVPDLAPPRKG